MSRILIAWELGANCGHLVPCLGVARTLRGRGHTVVFAVRDTRAATEFLSPAGFSFVQTPLFVRARRSRPPANYSELLLGEGYADGPGLLGRVRGWRSLVQLIRPDVILGDHAPTAIVAGYSLNIPCIAMGNGFTVPPRVSPLPSIRPWEGVSAARLAHADSAVNASISEVLKAVGSKRHRPMLVDLYQNALLYVFPQLDPFGPRKGSDYIGSISTIPYVGATKTWSKGAKWKILVYLRSDVEGFSELMEALSRIDAEKICVIPDMRPEQVSRWRCDQLLISTTPIAFEGLLRGADAVVNYGGSGLVGQSLLAGVPLVIVPRYVEQYLTAKQAEKIGVAVVVETNRRREKFDQVINKILEETTYRSRARVFADQYGNFDVQQAIERAASAVERAIG